MNAKMLSKLLDTMARIYHDEGIEEVNKRVGVVFGSNLSNFRVFEKEFQKHMEVKYGAVK